MKIITSVEELEEQRDVYKKANKSIGLVPTMGALHEGHVSLLEHSRKRADVTVCSIFVNPTQFNNKEDYTKYPRNLDEDIRLLNDLHCDVVFVPHEKEIYHHEKPLMLDLGHLAKVLEAKHRPRHFEGVVRIVKILFDLVQPNIAFFGLKDYQQIMVVQKLIETCRMNIELYKAPTIREKDGLAMSSRNKRLNSHNRTLATNLYQSLCWMSENKSAYSLDELVKQATNRFLNISEIELEYLSLCQKDTLMPIHSFEKNNVLALIAATVGGVRLIDNQII